MSIPGGFPKNRQPPMMRESVGGNVCKAILNPRFCPSMLIKAVDGDEYMFFKSPVMHGVSWMLSGITKDSTGAVLGSCHVDLYYTNTDQFISDTVSDPTTGVFSFLIGPNTGSFYLVAYKAGSPDVAGTTVNTLMPVAT